MPNGLHLNRKRRTNKLCKSKDGLIKTSFYTFLCRIDRFYQHYPNLRTIVIKFSIFDCVYIICFQQKFQPVTCFVGFFEGNLQFGDEIRFAVGILCFVYVCSDTGSGSADLIGNDRFVLTFQEFYQVQYLYRKINGSVRNLLSAIR